MSDNHAEPRRAALWRVAKAIATVAACLVVGLSIGMGTLLVADRMFPPDLGRLDAFSTTVTDKDDRPLCVLLGPDDAWRSPASVTDVPPLFVDMLLAYEDRRFFRHPGVDPLAAARAAAANLAAGRVVSGASTITMQVARLLEPRPRGWGAKFRQVARALQLEWRYDKSAILDMYLTLAPYGGNVEGVRAAAWAWFGKSPAALTPAEMATLVALPRAPTALRPDRAEPAALIAARDMVIGRAVGVGVLDAEMAADARTEPPPGPRHPFPRSAFHAARGLVADRAAEGAAVATIATTIDGDLQRAVEAALLEGIGEREPHVGVATLVVENATRAVRAHVGAPDPFDAARQGAIDMTRAIRSPGSTLKPFAYGMGFELGLIHPFSVVSDISTRFGGYAPRNFDGGFHGDLTVAEALRRSLNVPAVTVLGKVGPRRFVERLEEAGAELILPRGDAAPGLPVVLGGVGIDLWDLTSLYVAMAREGVAGPLRLRRDDPVVDGADGSRLLSAEAARATLRILEGTPPPDGLVSQAPRRGASVIALKTGTSFGFRDAWAVGVSSTHTVAVWVGRPDGTPSPGRYGLVAAAPLVYRLFDLLPVAPGRPSGVGALAALDDAPPAMLRRVKTGAPTPVKRFRDPPRLVFPPPGAVVERGADDVPIRLEARGGRRPFTWLVDGRPLTSPPLSRDAVWRPASNGVARITVIDALGAHASAAVEIR